jgi:hypothetical protein
VLVRLCSAKLRNGTSITAAINPRSVEGAAQIVDSAFPVYV